MTKRKEDKTKTTTKGAKAPKAARRSPKKAAVEEPVLLEETLQAEEENPAIEKLVEVGRVPLLTAEQEVSLAKRIERGRRAREVMAGSVVSVKRRRELQLHIEDGWAAREHLITANSRLVISVAKKYMGRGVPFLDLIQEGNIGLIRA